MGLSFSLPYYDIASLLSPLGVVSAVTDKCQRSKKAKKSGDLYIPARQWFSLYLTGNSPLIPSLLGVLQKGLREQQGKGLQ